MFSLINPPPVETIDLPKGLKRKDVRHIHRAIHSEFGVTVNIQEMGWGGRRHYRMCAEIIPMAVRRFLEEYLRNQGYDVSYADAQASEAHTA